MTPFDRRNPILRSVGISYVQGTVRGPTGTEVSVRFLIDSGATYSLLPDTVWQTIGLAPKRDMEFVLADGTTVRRPVSECHLPTFASASRCLRARVTPRSSSANPATRNRCSASS